MANHDASQRPNPPPPRNLAETHTIDPAIPPINDRHSAMLSAPPPARRTTFAQRLRTLIERALAHLFFLLFCAQILSPHIHGFTIYLEVLVAGLNPFFLRWAAHLRIRSQYLLSTAAVTFASIFAGPKLLIEVVALALAVLFLFYADNKNVFYLRIYLLLSTLVAVTQFVLTLTGSPLARLIGPTYISELVWGQWATPTYTNFFAIYALPRVSGLSREAGFFAALVTAYAALLFARWSRGDASPSPLGLLSTAIGYIVSFSKISFGLPLVLIIEMLRRYLSHIPFGVMLIAIVILATTFTLGFSDALTDDSGSIAHRLGGYPTLLDASLEQLFFGVSDVQTAFDNPYVRALPDKFVNFAGFAGFVLTYGLIVTGALLLALYFGGLSSVGLALLLLITANVTLVTNQNFVVLAYYVAFRYYADHKIFVWGGGTLR